MSLFTHKTIYCSYRNLARVSEKFLTKTVEADIHCDDKFCYYIRAGKRGIFAIRVVDWSIWKPGEFAILKKWRS